jgi:hypothetical protein
MIVIYEYEYDKRRGDAYVFHEVALTILNKNVSEIDGIYKAEINDIVTYK